MNAFCVPKEVNTMLEELYKYAVDSGITARAGFKEKSVAYYIDFDVDGNLTRSKKAKRRYAPIWAARRKAG